MNRAILVVHICFILVLPSFIFGLDNSTDELSLLGRGAGASGDVGTAALWGNPAGLAHAPQYAATAMYTNFWGISQYGSYCIGGLLSTKYITAGAYFSYFGSSDLYSELSTGAVLARSIYRIIDIGARVRFVQVGSPEPYGKASTVLFDFGLQHSFANRASVGFYWKNPAGISQFVGYDADELLSFGLRYNAASWASVFADVQFPKNAPGELYIGQELRISRLLSISGGVGGRPTKLYLGANFNWNDLTFSWAGTLHPEMGMLNGGKIEWEKR